MQLDVQTRSGCVRGLTRAGVSAFLGIPYAHPPVAERRLALPEPPTAWSGTRECTQLPPAPPQSSNPLISMLGIAPVTPTSEDCLYLNIWTPAADDARRPVLVWIPGGAFIGGTASTPVYDGARLAARGDVVVVSLSYRVGLLGFLHTEGVPANLGLRDQVRALRWIQDEIARFGGDPARVSVFGESAGAGSIVALLGMPEARGLFQRAIVQSAAPEGMIDLEESARRAGLLLGRLGIEPGDVEGLRSVGIDRVLRAQEDCVARDGPFEHNMLFVPVIDGQSLPRRPSAAIHDGAAQDIALIIGTTEEELALYATSPAMRAFDQAQLVSWSQRRADAAALDAYRRSRRARGADSSPAALFTAMESDRTVRWPAARLAAWQRKHQPQTYMYLFTWRSPILEGALGSCHALDLPFTFGNLDAPGMREFAGAGPAAERLATDLMDAWCAFARRGDPSHGRIGPWPAYDASERWTMQLGPSSGARAAPLEAERAVWDRLEPWARTPLTPAARISAPRRS
jgi:para-nitrobenzyl esterase